MPEVMTCPQCQATLTPATVGEVTVQQCPSCQGVFLARVDLGGLVEAENDWHRNRGATTQPMPRITEDMSSPPPARPADRSYIETLFA